MSTPRWNVTAVIGEEVGDYEVVGLPKYEADWLTFKVREGGLSLVTAMFPTRNVLSVLPVEMPSFGKGGDRA
jgi:hypothetical protein